MARVLLPRTCHRLTVYYVTVLEGTLLALSLASGLTDQVSLAWAAEPSLIWTNLIQ